MEEFKLNNIAKAYNVFQIAVAEDANNPHSSEDALNRLIPAIRVAERPFVGDADDYHNFSVAIIKKFEEYGIALEIIELGLEAFPKNTDLLSDAIRYSVNCEKPAVASNCYNILRLIDKSKWTWRAFSFSVDYLLGQYRNRDTATITEAIELVKKYQEFFPAEEDAWRLEQDIYKKTNQRSKAKEVLVQADKKFKFCPKCWLSYADMLIEDGDFIGASAILKKLCTNPLSAEDVNMAYVFYLDGICKMTLWQQTDAYESGEFDKKTVDAIYRSFRKALNQSDLRSDIESKVKNFVKQISFETGILSNIEGCD